MCGVRHTSVVEVNEEENIWCAPRFQSGGKRGENMWCAPHFHNGGKRRGKAKVMLLLATDGNVIIIICIIKTLYLRYDYFSHLQ